MDENLRDSAQQGNIDALYFLIWRDAYVFDTIDKIPFVETLLHIAASTGHTQFAMEIMRLKPTFARKLNQDGFSPMYLALQNNQTQVVLLLLEVDEDLVCVQGKEGWTPLLYIAQTGNLHLLAEFLRACPKSIEDVTIQQETVLQIALKYNMSNAFRLLLGWLRRAWFRNASLWEKKLLNWQDEDGNTVLDTAVPKNQPQPTKSRCINKQNQQIKDMLRCAKCFSIFHRLKVESFADYLRDVAEQGSIDALYALIGRDAIVLDKIDEIQFVETPLHIAASAGHTMFAMEIMRLKPSFARKLNQDGFTPIHLALQNNKTQLVYRLVVVDKDLDRVQGRKGVTPLHYVAQTGNLDPLAEFLVSSPMSIKDLTIQGETALHIALNNNHLHAFELLIRWLQQITIKDASFWEKTLLNWKDEEGNTVLHIAVSNNQSQAVRWLLNAGVDINTKNLGGFTVLDILQGQIQINNSEIKDMLCRAGALSASSLPTVKSHEAFLRSPSPIYKRFAILMLRQQMNMTIDKRVPQCVAGGCGVVCNSNLPSGTHSPWRN